MSILQVPEISNMHKNNSKSAVNYNITKEFIILNPSNIVHLKHNNHFVNNYAKNIYRTISFTNL